MSPLLKYLTCDVTTCNEVLSLPEPCNVDACSDVDIEEMQPIKKRKLNTATTNTVSCDDDTTNSVNTSLQHTVIDPLIIQVMRLGAQYLSQQVMKQDIADDEKQIISAAASNIKNNCTIIDALISSHTPSTTESSQEHSIIEQIMSEITETPNDVPCNDTEDPTSTATSVAGVWFYHNDESDC